MTTVRDTGPVTGLQARPGPAGDWFPTLQGQLGTARNLLGNEGEPGAAAADQAGQALRQASDALMALLSEFGVETPLGWRLHELRSRLDAHLLAASALADADADDAVVGMLRRSLDFIGPELEAVLNDVSG